MGAIRIFVVCLFTAAGFAFYEAFADGLALTVPESGRQSWLDSMSIVAWCNEHAGRVVWVPISIGFGLIVEFLAHDARSARDAPYAGAWVRTLAGLIVGGIWFLCICYGLLLMARTSGHRPPIIFEMDIFIVSVVAMLFICVCYVVIATGINFREHLQRIFGVEGR